VGLFTKVLAFRRSVKRQSLKYALRKGDSQLWTCSVHCIKQITFGSIAMNKKALRKIAVTLVVVTLFSFVELLTAPSVMAITPWVSITPGYGVVGDQATVTGAINTTDGGFTVRWNQALNFTGLAIGNDVTKSFEVPSTVGAPYPSGRNVTVELIDEALDAVVAATNFTLFTKFEMQVVTPPPPKQLQESNKTSIKVSVTGGLPNTVYIANITVKNPADQAHSKNVPLSNTTTTGSGSGTTVYPTDFDAHTNLTGTYIVSSNVTADRGEFFVGLTDKTEYRRKEPVLIQAAGYTSSEIVKVDIRTGGSSVEGFPQNSTASSACLVKLSWTVPLNATPGTYSVTLTNTTSSGTVKAPSDTQNFNITGAVCLVQAINLADEPVEGALIEVYNASAPTSVLTQGSTNSTGWIRFNLDTCNYTFKAFFKNAESYVPSNQTITEDTKFSMKLRLVNLIATVETVEGQRIPLIDIASNCSYTARDKSKATAVAAGRTNATGIAVLRNLFTNVTYTVEARRYGMLFNTTTVFVEPLPASGWVSLPLTLPNCLLSVHALDSKNRNATEINIRAYEWASGVGVPIASNETDLSGYAFFSLPFGRYILRAYRGEDFVSEAVVDLDKPLVFTFNLKTLFIEVNVFVFDYFGHPIANAEVKIERQTSQGFIFVSSQPTSGSGLAQFGLVVGGDFRVSVYIAGNLVAVKKQFLGAGSEEVAFIVAEYVALIGYPIAAGAFALVVFSILVLIIVALVLARKRVSRVFRRKPKR